MGSPTLLSTASHSGCTPPAESRSSLRAAAVREMVYVASGISGIAGSRGGALRASVCGDVLIDATDAWLSIAIGAPFCV